MILLIPELKARFATTDQPSAKDFSDFIDTVIAVAQSNMIASTLAAVNAAIAAIATGAQIVVQPVPPNASHAGSIWLKTDPATASIIRAYNFSTSDSNWHSRHPLQPGTIIAITDTTFNIAGIASYDGGGTPGSGAMWSNATDLAGLVLLGAGGSYAIGATGGEATHVLTSAEMPGHTHAFVVNANNTDSSGSGAITGGTDNATSPRPDGSFSGTTASTGDGAAHNNLQPYKTAYFIRRTTRLDYVEAPGA